YLHWLSQACKAPVDFALSWERYGLPSDEFGAVVTTSGLDEDASTAALVEAIAAAGGEMRRRASRAAEAVDRLVSEARSNATAGQEAVRDPLADADQLARGAAPLLSRAPWVREDGDPIRLLRTYDVQALLVWQGHQAVDDFWGF